MMGEYPSNSNALKDKQNGDVKKEKPKKVIEGKATLQKKGGVRKLTEVFISEDAKNVKSYIFTSVIVPAIQKTLVDAVTNGLNMIFYGEGGRRESSSVANKVSYRGYFNSNAQRDQPAAQQRKAGFDYKDVEFDTKSDANRVIDAMNEIILQYGVVSVGDLYDLSDVSTDNFTVHKYGWTDISGCKAVLLPERGTYVLKLPKARPIN